MKHKLNNIVLVMLATIVFFVGAGVTVFNFCCPKCIENIATIEDLNHNLCADSSSLTDVNACCADMNIADHSQAHCTDRDDEQAHCNIERISVDIEHSHINSQLSLPFVWSSIIYNLTIPKVVKIASDKFEKSYKTPLSLPPRDYLALIRILII